MDTAWITFIFTVFILTRNQADVLGDCASDLVNYFNINHVIYLPENAVAGEVIANITEFELEAATAPSYYLDVVDGTLRSNKTLSLDGPQNKEECAKTIITPPRFAIKCKNAASQPQDVHIIFKYTDDFTSMIQDITVRVPEDTPVKTSILDPASISTDEDCNNGFLFFVAPLSDYFAIDGRSLLVLTRQLDYERQQEHNVSIAVRSSVDSANFRISNATVTVLVTDVDDMNPVFDISNFVLHVQEEQPASSVWFNASPPIQARDGDVGINTPLVYSVEYSIPNINLDIHNMTAEIQILDKLDREQISSYTVQIKAAQVDLLYKSATATLSIIVDDINDNRPVYTSLTSATIMEDARTGSYVIQLAGTDKDEAANAEFAFLIVSDNLGAFEIAINSITKTAFLAVKNSSALRGHEEAQIKLYLKETSPINGGLVCDMITICMADITVNITDVNDNDPIFTSSRYDFTVNSSQSGSTDIGRVEARDADRGENAKIDYSLTPFIGPPSECSKLILDPGSGKLTLTQQLMVETECYWLVTACDTPIDPSLRRCSSVPMSLKVLPSADTIFLNATVPENVPIQTLVMSLPIKGLQTSSPNFEIKEDMLYTNSFLDRETKDRYTVQLFTANNVNSAAVVVSVNIQDVNDNAPNFTYTNYVINLDESVKINQILLQVNATDADIDDNGRFEFSLATGGEWFEIDSTTGQIKLVNFLRTNNVDFLLRVTDFGQPPLQSLATLKVYTPVYNETATLLLPVAKAELMQDRDGVAMKLSSILEVTVNILAIESIGPVSKMGSRLYIKASKNGQAVSPTELSKLVEDKSAEVYKAFMKATSPADKGTDDLGTLNIILICVAGTLLLLVIVVGMLWIRSHNKYKRSVRLLDTLSRDTTIYNNPRKLTAASSGNNNNNNVNNAEEMLDSISKGSVGNSSVTRLLPRLGLVNPSFELDESLTPPAAAATDHEGGPQTVGYENVTLSHASSQHIISDYENMLLSHASNPLIDNYTASPNVTTEEPVTRFGPDISDVITISSSPIHVTTIDIRQRSHGCSPPQMIDPEIHTGETWPGDNDTPLTERHDSRKSSGADSGMPSDKENRLEDSDENDQEVANIMSEAELSDNTIPSPIISNLDLMTAFPQSQQSPLEQHDNTQTMSNEGNKRDANVPPEPEPDYAKKVRFIEEPTTTTEENEPVLDSSSHNVLVDASDEMTAL